MECTSQYNFLFMLFNAPDMEDNLPTLNFILSNKEILSMNQLIALLILRWSHCRRSPFHCAMIVTSMFIFIHLPKIGGTFIHGVVLRLYRQMSLVPQWLHWCFPAWVSDIALRVNKKGKAEQARAAYKFWE